ncbi:toll/interleukin-1 receptor domain-containing protein [Mesorhizobium sp. L103C105A0]|uniref:TIR domain-containing protein n=1 Tax=Mesorhizobium sp. L103C105A0 TaxID=1287074 RepID=UPI0003D03D97|nr:toll/interleukin-1 receptor domain-containing protein [Mesorhizobium sp. L103C105A0]ESZ78291.1 hypothetical protein X726_03590 [Mesorhizobium sp. L103C105A0]
MSPFSVFLSYSHNDEWLKDELVKHLSALKRSGIIDVWHDRLIPAGKKLGDAIDEKVNTSDIFLFLISSDFLHSDYCFHREYEIAKVRHLAGEAEIVPIIVRDCDWEAGDLRSFNALPIDGNAVSRNAGSKPDSQQRDAAWLSVINGVKVVIAELKKKNTPPSLSDVYIDRLFQVDFIKHPNVEAFDERRIFIDPDIYWENQKEQLTSFESFADAVMSERASIITGEDRSGKSLLAKKLQVYLDSLLNPAVLIKGKAIRNAQIEKLINSSLTTQYGQTEFPKRRFTIIVDDFDECGLPDRVKESIIKDMVYSYGRLVILSYSSAASVLFTADELPDPSIFKINELTNDKLYQLVGKWKSVGLAHDVLPDDKEVLVAHDKIQLIFNHSEVERFAYTAVTFLELLDSASGGDLAVASFAACYDTLVTNRLHKAGVDWRAFDESKNFLSYLAYSSFIETESKEFKEELFTKSLDFYQETYLSSRVTLRKMALSSFLAKEDDEESGFFFREEYLWYFFCARFVAKQLSKDENEKYKSFIDHCAKNIFQKKYANMIIFVAYFSDDDHVMGCLLGTLDGLFSKADSWLLSDRARELMLGITLEEKPDIEATSKIDENRRVILREKVQDIIGQANKVVARYTLPFLSSSIGDSEFVTEIKQGEIDGDSYMRSVNALFRIHSVLGQVLSTRAGTYSASSVLACITKMVQASGRYASLNHSVATVLMFDAEKSRAEVDIAIKGELSLDEKMRKVQRIFAFWSVYLSQAGLARYLSHSHSIRALERLVEQYEGSDTSEQYPSFNFTSVLMVAKLYETGRVSRDGIDQCIKKYGENSALMLVLRVALQIYSYYMPMDIEEKQWVSARLGLTVRRIEAQRFKASKLGSGIVNATRRLPNPKKD